MHLNQVVVRVYVLLHQTFHFKKGWQQIPLVSGRVDGIRKRLVVVEGLEERIEGVAMTVLREVRIFIGMGIMLFCGFPRRPFLGY